MVFEWIGRLFGIKSRKVSSRKKDYNKRTRENIQRAYATGLKAVKKLENALLEAKYFSDSMTEMQVKHRSRKLIQYKAEYEVIKRKIELLIDRTKRLEQMESAIFKEDEFDEGELDNAIQDAKKIEQDIFNLQEANSAFKTRVTKYYVDRIGYDFEKGIQLTTKGVVVTTSLMAAEGNLAKFIKFEKKAEESAKSEKKTPTPAS